MFEILALIIVFAVIAVLVLVGIFILKKTFPSLPLNFKGNSQQSSPDQNTSVLNNQKNTNLAKSDTNKYQSQQPFIPAILKASGAFIIALLSLYSLGFLSSLSNERSRLYTQVAQEVGQSWGNSQTVAGPILVVPYQYQLVENESYQDKNGEKRIREITRTLEDKLVILPQDLNMNIEILYDYRYRGIYQALVYNAKIVGSAKFTRTDFKSINARKIYFDKSYISFSVSDNKAIQQVNYFSVNNHPTTLNSGTHLNIQEIKSGFHALIDQNIQDKPVNIGFSIDLRGSNSVQVYPMSENTSLQISSNWIHPSFNGLLPNSHQISKSGFSANWDVSHLVRNYPQSFRETQSYPLNEVMIEAMLFQPVTHYSKVYRSIKYGVLFIALTFLTLFFFDKRSGFKLNLVHYCLVGVSLSLFYSVLLALSEHIGFLLAYISAAILAAISIAAYIGVALKQRSTFTLLVSLLLGLYGILYAILQLEQYALLMGTLLLVTLMLAMMYFTRSTKKTSSRF